MQYPPLNRCLNLVHIKRHYYMNHRHINPTGVVPVGRSINFDTPSSRSFGAYLLLMLEWLDLSRGITSCARSGAKMVVAAGA